MATAATQTLTVEKEGNGTGTVTSSPAGIECGGTCAAPFTEGSKVVLKGAPGANTAAVKWTGCTTINLENECSVTMSAEKTVTAIFDLVKRKLTVEKKGDGTGTVTSSPAGISCETCWASFSIGTAVTLTAAPGPKTLKPSWAGCDSVNAENKCLVTMSTAKLVTVTFESSEHQLNVKKAGTGGGKVTSSPAGIDCGSTCMASFGTGALVTLTGAAEAGSQPVAWTGCDSVDAENKCLVTMSAAKAVTATFNLASHQLTVSKVGTGTGTVTSSPAGIECGSTCSSAFDNGTTVTLTAVKGIHTLTVKWAGCDNVVAEVKCLVAMNAAHAVTATFGLDPLYVEYTVSIQRKGTGAGTVKSSPGGIECGEDCSEVYVFKTAVTLIATPAPGSEFSHWSGGTCSGTGPCERKINSTRTVNAVFVAVGSRTLDIAMAGTGAGTVKNKRLGIVCTASCSPSIAAGTKLTLTAEPAAGSTFSGWSGACSGTATCKVQMNEARSVTATFAKVPTPPSPGVVVVAGAAEVKGGRASLRLTCSGGPCKGTLKLRAKIKQGKKTKNLTIGKGSFSLPLGASTTLKVKLSGAAKKALVKGKHGTTLKAKVTGSGIARSTVTLKPAKK